MDRQPEAYRMLVQELGLAWRHISGQYEKNQEMSRRIADQRATEFDWASLGYTIHNFYNALENYFLRIAKFFENSLDTETWHRDLVDRMALSIEGVRPALLPDEVRHELHELRSFRHVFRNIYDSTLDPERVDRVNQTLPPIMQVMEKSHLAFQAELNQISEGLA